MIYKKDANFPYPVLSNRSTSYPEAEFKIDLSLNENVDTYRFSFTIDLTSTFIKNLLSAGKAEKVLVVQSRDNKFFKINSTDSYIEIPKTRISLTNRTTIQMYIQATEEVSFTDNFEMDEFYSQFKQDIVVPKHGVLAMSDIVLFEGVKNESLDLFEKKLDPDLNSDIKIELGPETIIIHYKSADLQFIGLQRNTTLNNSYIYIGLRSALQQFIYRYGEGEEYVELGEVEPENALDTKLYVLMGKKMITELNIHNLDEVIYAISDRIIEKFASTVKGLVS